jgi:thiamine biosynthesis protein ThiS
MIAVTMNGETRQVEDGTTVAGFLDSLGLGRDRVAVEWNGLILKRELWASTTLESGAKLEVVHFVGGG